MSATLCWGGFKIFQFASAMHQQKKTAKDSAETFVYYVGNSFGMPQHFAKDYDLFFLTVF